MGKILKDLDSGDDGENLVRAQLEELGYICKLNKDKDTRSDYDLLANEITIEVKNDLYAKRSGNIAIEYNNCRSNKPSGLSITKADIWCHIIDGKPLIVKTDVLKEFILNNKPKRIVEAAGDGNADLYLYAIVDIEHIFKPLIEIGNL